MVNVVISADSRYRINKAGVQAAVLDVLRKHNVLNKVEIEVSVVGNRKMHELNKKYRGIDSTTDVLSFALQEGGKIGFVSYPDKILRLGSIIISYPEALKDAALEGITIDDEINFLVKHGTDHLLGIHHD